MRPAVLLLVLLGVALFLAPAASGGQRVSATWPESPGAVQRTGQTLTVRVRAVRRTPGPRPLADVALLSLASSGRPRAVLVRRRARARTFRVRVPRSAAGPVRLRIRVAGRTLVRRFRVAAPAPAAPGGTVPLSGPPNLPDGDGPPPCPGARAARGRGPRP